jgi:hypothetical protein
MKTDRWQDDLESTQEEMERHCRTHSRWPQCDCHLCQVIGLLSDALCHLRQHPATDRPNGPGPTLRPAG